MDYKKLELKLRRIVEKRIEEGWLLEPFDTGNALLVGVGACCPMMAAVIEGPHEINSNFVAEGAEMLGIDFGKAKSIECGFENWKHYEDEKCFQIGARIRRDYCEFDQ